MKGELKTPEFTQINRFQRVPVLLLDDGTVISETMAICRYFEETKPEPALFGTGPLQRAMVEMWNRRMELDLLFCVAQVFRHLHPAMAQLEVPQVGAWGEANRPRVLEILQYLDEELGTRRYIAGDALLGCRYYGAGRHRFHEAGPHSTAGRLEKPCALAWGGV